jgi:hypothetical protein
MFYGEMDQAQANEHTSTHAFSKTYDNDRNFVSQFTINSHTAHKELQQRIRTGKLHRHRQIRTQISTCEMPVIDQNNICSYCVGGARNCLDIVLRGQSPKNRCQKLRKVGTVV